MEEQMEDQIDLLQTIKFLFIKLPVILAVGLICGLAAFAYSSWFMPSIYSTNVKLYVNNQQGISESIKVQGTDISTSGTLADVYGAMIKTDRVLEEVAMNTGLGYSTSQLSAMISTSVANETPLLVVFVRSTVPEHAQTIANVVADIAPSVIQEVAKGSSAEIVDRAKLPQLPDSPNVGRITLAGLIVGLILGAILVLLANKFDLRIKRISQLADNFDLPILGMVSGGSGYDSLRTGIRFSFTKNGCRRVAFTGSAHNDGKGSVAAGLARSLAESGKRTLLIDGGLGSPEVAAVMKLDDGPGLSNILVGDVGLDAALRKNAGKNLDVICSGQVPPDPVELLSCGEMEKLMETLSANYDYIVLVAPAVRSEAEARVLARLADGAVITVKNRRTAIDKTADAIGFLKASGARIVGFVFNKDKK